jgi:sugar O-acyltransferase (sialic acid O-acetyltransferase NeuD family)
MDENATKSIAKSNGDSIIILGGGGHAKVVVSILRKLFRFSILGYTDVKNNGALLGVPYLGSDVELTKYADEHEKLNAALAVGQVGLGRARCSLWEKLQTLAVAFPPIISPSAIVNEDVSIGEGTVAMDGVVINSCACIGRGAIVNTKSVIEHDVILDDWVHVAPGATVCGGVKVGRYSMIGAGATIIEGRQITTDCIVGAGATVIHDLTEPGVYVGCPARRIGS